MCLLIKYINEYIGSLMRNGMFINLKLNSLPANVNPKEKNNNFIMEEPGRHHLTPVVEVPVTGDVMSQIRAPPNKILWQAAPKKMALNS